MDAIIDECDVPWEAEVQVVGSSNINQNWLINNKGNVKRQDLSTFRWWEKKWSPCYQYQPLVTFGSWNDASSQKLICEDSFMNEIQVQINNDYKTPKTTNSWSCFSFKRKFWAGKPRQSSTDLMAELLK